MSQVAINEINKRIKELTEEKNQIIENIKNDLIDSVIVEVGVSCYVWGKPEISIGIQPRSAWTDVITLRIMDDKEILETSSGGWDKPENALVEVNYITSKLIEFTQKFDRSLIDKLAQIEKRIYELLGEREKFEYIMKKENATKGYKQINIEDYLDSIKNGKALICYRFNNHMILERVEHYNNRFRLNGSAISKKDLINYFKYNCYIKE